MQEKFFDFSPDPFGRKVVEPDPCAQLARSRIELELKASGELNRPEHAQAVLWKGPGVDGPQHPSRQILAAAVGIDVLAGEGIPGDRVDSEVPPPCGFFGAQIRIASDGEGPVASTDLRFGARERHVNIGDFVNSEALADGVDRSDRGQYLMQARR